MYLKKMESQKSKSPLLNQNQETYGSVSREKRSEIAAIARSLGPLVLTFVLQFLLQTTTVFVSGRLGAHELAVVSLALCLFNITALAFYQGMGTSLDSFCSQAFGAGRPLMVGVYFQRCSLMMMAVTIFPLFPLWWFSGLLLKCMVPSEDLAIQCQTFLRIMTLGCPGLLFFETGKRFFQAQNLFNAGTYALAVSVPIHILLNWLLVLHPKYGLGLPGAPIALSLSFWVTALCLILYGVVVDGKQCWGGLDLKKATVNWKPMLSLAIPGVVMVEAEYLAFEVLTILAASFGTNALAAQSIGASVGAMAFQIPFAVSVAVTTRIGHYVGHGNTEAAEIVTRIALCFGAFMGLVNFSVLFLGRTKIAGIYTQDKNVIQIASGVLALAGTNQIFDCLNIVSAGVLRGQGRQKIGSVLSLVSYYCVALPLASIFAFIFAFEVYGLWYGLISGVAVLAMGEVFCVARSNWERIVMVCSSHHDV